MANPVEYTLTYDTWQKIATSVSEGIVIFYRRSSNSKYLFTNRDTGTAAPANTPTDDSKGGIVNFVTMPKGSQMPEIEQVPIRSSRDIDVYVKSVNPGETGKVVVTL